MTKTCSHWSILLPETGCKHLVCHCVALGQTTKPASEPSSANLTIQHMCALGTTPSFNVQNLTSGSAETRSHNQHPCFHQYKSEKPSTVCIHLPSRAFGPEWNFCCRPRRACVALCNLARALSFSLFSLSLSLSLPLSFSRHISLHSLSSLTLSFCSPSMYFLRRVQFFSFDIPRQACRYCCVHT